MSKLLAISSKGNMLLLHCRQRYRQWQAALRQRALLSGGSAADPAEGAAEHTGLQDDDDLHDGMCVICMQRNSNTVFPACGHMCTCTGCACSLNRCPISRSRGRSIRVYRS